MKHNTWSPSILRFKLTLISFALNPCIKSNIFPGICRMHEQFCRFYQLSKKCEARPGPLDEKARPGPARSTLSVCEPGPLRPGPFRPGPPGLYFAGTVNVSKMRLDHHLRNVRGGGIYNHLLFSPADGHP